ncbi:flagellar hook-length control protein FliK [bacterium LRH843]|nr:flagellar hook-length control protein FliK [bacterium LRH843]
MNPIMMTVKAPAGTSYPQPQAKNVGSGSNHSSFLQLLGGLLTDQTDLSNQLEFSPKGEEQGPMDLFGQAVEGLDMTELFDQPEAMKLLSLLPEEWQQTFIELTTKEHEDIKELVEEWTELQQALFIILAAVQQRDKLFGGESNPLFQKVGQMASLMFPNVHGSEKTRQPSAILTDVMEHIEMKLQSIPKGLVSGQSFTALLAAREDTKLSLPSTLLYQGNQEVIGKGLNQTYTPGQEFPQTMTQVEQAVIHLGNNVPKEVQQQQFLRQFQLILGRGVLSTEQGSNTLSIKLFPAHLGRIDIQITQIDGIITAKILAASNTSRELIEGQIAHLRQAFLQQQIPVERIEVAEQYVRDDNGDRDTDRQDRRDKQQSDGQENKEALFQEYLNELTFNEEA